MSVRADGNLGAVLETVAQGRGTALAVATDDGPSATFADLVSRACRAASALSALGVEPGDRVALIQRNTIDHIVDWFATLLVGGIVVDVSFLLAPEEHRHILEDAAPVVLAADDGLVDPAGVPAGITVVSPDLASRTSDLLSARSRSSDDAAVIAYTSGTTGLPKGVVHTHGAVARQLDLLHRVCGYDDTWISYVAIPLFSLHGFLPQVAAPLLAGGSVLLDDKFDARRVAEVSRRHRIAYTTLSSPMIPRLLDLPPHERPDLSHIRLLSCGGSPLHPDLRREFEESFGVHLAQGYSCTEVLGAFVMDIDGDAPHGAAGRVYPDERLADGPVVRVVDDDLRPVAAGERGEIQFHRRFAMARYWGAPEATEDAFVGGDWYATGDIGSVDQDGFLAVLDRKKDVIIRGGFNIYSAEIERVLTQHPGVAESAVVGRPDLALGEVPVAFVVPTDASVSAELLHEYVRGRLGRLKEPATIELVAYDELPRNGLGKVIKAQLRARLATTSG